MTISGPLAWIVVSPFLLTAIVVLHLFGGMAIDRVLNGCEDRRAEREAEELGGFLIDAEHHIQRHERTRPSLTLVQERQAVADLQVYRERRAQVSTIRPPRGAA